LKFKPVYVCKGKNIQEEKKKGLKVHIWPGSCMDYDTGARKNKKLIKPKKPKISNRKKKPIRKIKKKHSVQSDFGFVRLKSK
jgi:hypothetical protein